MKKIDIYCKKCNHKFTKEPITEMDKDKLNNKDGEELLPLGCFTINTNFLFDMEISYLINTDSVLLHNHEDSERYSGCCGPSEMSKYNQVCPNCNEEVGVEILDCWLPHFIGISKEKTRIKTIFTN